MLNFNGPSDARLFFFDTETTGLPRDWNAPLRDLDNWPRLVQLAWLLCDEAGLETPTWAQEAGSVQEPWLVSGIESLRGLAFAESPAPFRRRRIFVLGNFLSRA